MQAFRPADMELFSKTHGSHYAVLKKCSFNFIDFVNSEETFTNMKVVTDALELPALAGIAKSCAAPIMALTPNATRNAVKRSLGTLVGVIMEANGYKKTGIKRNVPPIAERVFTAGEVYERTDDVDPD